MDINQRTAKIPFWVLFGLAAGISLFDIIFTYLFLSSNPQAHEGNPVHAYLASVVGLQYFLFLIPLVPFAFYGATAFGAWAIRRLDKQTEVDGKNFVAVIIILLTFPNVLVNEILVILFGKQVMRYGPAAPIAAVVSIIVYVALAEMADRKFKKKQTESSQTH
jgi:hypothetical protein